MRRKSGRKLLAGELALVASKGQKRCFQDDHLSMCIQVNVFQLQFTEFGHFREGGYKIVEDLRVSLERGDGACHESECTDPSEYIWGLYQTLRFLVCSRICGIDG